MKHVVIGTAGHIDHGKSALVLALTGTDPDRLQEEKRRGITIDLGFARLDLGQDLRLAFVDVPGHERFVKNMLAGASGIDLVMLVIAADESIKPQTREHFDICKLLGIQQGLVAITKSDLVEPDLLEIVRLEVQEFVSGSFLEGAPIVPVSARTREGLDELKAELRRLSLAASARPTGRPFRLPIDRAFVMKGFGTVVTGTLAAGRIERESEVEIYPSGRRARVRGIEVHNQAASVALAGQRTAVNLASVDLPEITRGMVLGPPGMFEASRRLDCAVSLLASARPLKNRSRVHFHCGTAEMLAEVVLVESRELKAGERAYAQLRLAEPGIFLPGDRFIIRQFSPVSTIGGGTVLDNHPRQHRAGDAAARQFLEVLEQGDFESRLERLVKDRGEAPLSALVARTGENPAEVLRLAEVLEKRRRVVRVGQPPSLLIHAEYFRELSESVLKVLADFHEANPLLPGLAREDLRGRLAAPCGDPSRQRGHGRSPAMPAPSGVLFGAVVDALAAQGKIELQGERARLAGRAVQLTAEESAVKARISDAFEKAGLSVPSAAEVLAKLPVDRARAEKILQILLKEKALVRVADGLIFHCSALEGLRGLLAERKAASNRLDVGGFKELTGLSRKYAIPLLEYLDREHITRRQGDERIIL
ncbi:MAG TPA: selenocysteine-specific translation elongation factor [Terriglobia bacterium]|nr:selenocysteine-specific translation elongation factor [Terriglobia bacterium]